MNTLNRKIQPKFKKIEKINIIEAQNSKLDNNIDLYTINAGTEDILKMEIIFDAGVWWQKQTLVASFTNSLLLGGTKKHSSAELANKIDFFGADINSSIGYNSASIVIYTLSKHLDSVVEIVADIIENSIFPESELLNTVDTKRHEFIVNSNKVEYIARSKFMSAIFGANHPYGKFAVLQDYDKLDTTLLKNHYTNYYTANNCRIIMSGKVGEKEKQIVNKYLGKHKISSLSQKVDLQYDIISAKEKKIYIDKEKAVQSAIRIGTKMINLKHPDYIGMQIVNSIVGGYFGSRLMKNIREEKGYTYGIGSGVVSLTNSGYFIIATEVAKEVKHKVVEEIYYEINKMKTEKISLSELELVKNYMMGQMQRGFDGPFALSNAFKKILLYNQDYSYYYNLIDKIKNITANEIIELSNKYFDTDKFIEVVVG